MGGYWFGVARDVEVEPVGCRWVAENGDTIGAIVERFPARPDMAAIGEWLWISAEEPLDSWSRWKVECQQLGSGCDIHGCGHEALSPTTLPIVEVTGEAASASLEQLYLERWSCGRNETDVLRVQLSALPHTFWTRGGAVRVRYPDGRWAVTLPAGEEDGGLLAPLPAPAPDERALVIELVDGGAQVAARFEAELEAELWAHPRRRGPAGETASARGCRRR